MFKPFLKFSTFSLLYVLTFTSCAKDEKTEEDPSTGGNGTTSTGGFTWTPGGGSSVSANDFFFVTAFNNIIGKKTSNGSYVDITLDDLSLGTYSISPSKGILFEYNDGTKSYYGTSGIVTITSKSGTLISGNFTSAISNSTLSSISGQFIDVPEK